MPNALTAAFFLLLSPVPGAALPSAPHVGPVAGNTISIDGEGADWPADALHLPLVTGSGKATPSSLRLAYEPSSAALLVLLETPEPPAQADLFIDIGNDVALDRPVQLTFDGELSGAQTGHGEAAKVASAPQEGRHGLEWRIDLHALGAPAVLSRPVVLGFDVEVTTGEGETLRFGAKDNRWLFDRRLPRVMLVPSGTGFGWIEGKTAWRQLEASPPRWVEIAGHDGSFVLRRETDPLTGAFRASVPAGRYAVRAFDTRTLPSQTRQRRVRIGEGRTTSVRPLIADAPSSDDFSALVEELMALHNIKALGVVHIEGGETKVSETYGTEPDGSAADAQSVFKVASVTKPVAASVVLTLVEKGLWSLDRPLAEYWVDPGLEGQEAAGKVTTRMVLSHTTGLPNHRGEDPLGFLHHPGTVQSYSGEGFTWLRKALETHFGKPFQALAEEHLFAPLGMERASFAGPKPGTTYLGKYHYDYAFEDPSWEDANLKGGLMIGPEGLERYLHWLLGGANWSDDLWAEVLDANSEAILSEDTQGYDTFGLGFVVNRDGALTMSHGGSEHGARAYLLVLPETDSALVVVTNAAGGIPAIRALAEATVMKDRRLPAIDAALTHWESFEW
jgi:CubicO group peptidase (beta-lactamase class C family)